MKKYKLNGKVKANIKLLWLTDQWRDKRIDGQSDPNVSPFLRKGNTEKVDQDDSRKTWLASDIYLKWLKRNHSHMNPQ